MAAIKLTKVKKVYDNEVVAVHDFDLDIKDKEFIVFVGPSGCGKSTTLRMIAGLEEISDGTLEFDGVVVNDLQPKDRGVAMVFQNYALYPHLSVFENMAFSLRLSKMDNDEVYRRVVEAAETLGITQYLTRKPRALSGGQRQRVAIGRAMVRDSKVFLMDEPLSNLDAKLRNQMRAEIIKLRQKIDSTFIYVTHDQVEAMTLGDRIVIMKDGFIQQVGTPTEVFECPVNLFVAGFIGAPQMNTFKTELVCRDGKYFVTPFGATIEIDGKKAELLKERGIGSQQVVMGIRPPHVKLMKEKTDGAVGGTVDVSEMMGSEIHLHVNVNGEDIIMIIPATDLPEEWRAGIPYGTQIFFTFPGKLIHLFDPETEKSLLYS